MISLLGTDTTITNVTPISIMGGGISLWLTVMSLLLRLGKTNEIQDVAFKKDISYLEENNQQITSTDLCELIYIYLFEGGK